MSTTNSKTTQAPYPLAQSTLSADEIDAVKVVLESGRFTMGHEVEAFEREFAAWTGARHALMVNSGSSANLLIVDALLRSSKGKPRLKPGDEVLVPALAWPTTVWPVLQLGLAPVFVDIDPVTLSVDIKSMEASLSPKTKAVFVIHVLGQMADMKPLRAFCDKHGLVLIEDVCESLGAYQNGTHAGTFGLMGSYSCYFSHHITTIEGGLIVTSDDTLINDLKSLRSHGWIRGRSDSQEWIDNNPDIDSRFMFIMAGYNVRSTEIQATIGRVQLKKLDSMLKSREQMAIGTHTIAQKQTPWIKLIGSHHLPTSGQPTTDRRSRTHSWMSLPFMLQKEAPVDVKAVKALFEKLGIETRPIIAGNMAKHPSSKTYGIRTAPSLSNADHVLKNGFMIGCHPFQWQQNLELLQEAFSQASRF